MERLLRKVEYIKGTMMAVATGEERIQSVNEEYKKVYKEVTKDLRRHGYSNPNPYSDLWEWYQKWSSGDMPQYKDRRAYLIELFKELLTNLENNIDLGELDIELTGWDRIERSLEKIRHQVNEAIAEEEFQTVGLLCRETIISLAQEVYDAENHHPIDGVKPSDTDSKRMLDAYFVFKLPGKENKAIRRYAKSTNTLANELTHKRTATMKLAKLCASSTINLVNLTRIIEEED